MPNKTIIKNKLAEVNPELGEALEKEGKRSLTWGVQPDRKNKNPKNKEKPENKEEADKN